MFLYIQQTLNHTWEPGTWVNDGILHETKITTKNSTETELVRVNDALNSLVLVN